MKWSQNEAHINILKTIQSQQVQGFGGSKAMEAFRALTACPPQHNRPFLTVVAIIVCRAIDARRPFLHYLSYLCYFSTIMTILMVFSELIDEQKACEPVALLCL